MNFKEIKALISLLDDEDVEVLTHVENKIMSLGNLIIPFLENEWEMNFNPHVQRRIEDLIHNLQINTLRQNLKNWQENEQGDLLKGIWLIATYQYPDLEFKVIKKEIEKIYYEVWLNHRTYSSPYDQTKNLKTVIFDKLNFTSNTQNIYAPGNSMINTVLETRRGNPISLCIIYILIAQRLKMPIYGVNLPNLFVLTYKSEETQFYINAFNKGVVFTKNDIDNYIAQLKLEPDERFYQPCSNLDILKRVIRNLTLAFEKLGEPYKVDEVKSLLQVLEND